jgi:hypothetical protein
MAPAPFSIDTAVAKALRDDHERLSALVRKRSAPRKYGGPLSAAEVEEVSKFLVRQERTGVACAWQSQQHRRPWQYVPSSPLNERMRVCVCQRNHGRL